MADGTAHVMSDGMHVVAVVGRVEGGRTLLDLRCVPPESDDAVVAAVLALT
jgi:hypothetical protein